MGRAHPRLRGEHVAGMFDATSGLGSSPLTRGAHALPLSVSMNAGLIPAYAGSTRAAVVGKHERWAHPRLRGEHCAALSLMRRRAGSSPLTRGALDECLRILHTNRLIPAYAGSTCR